MYVMILRVLLLNYVCLAAKLPVKHVKKKDEFKHVMETKEYRAPFFELPCMHIGGTCSNKIACPSGTKVMQRGLCPQQQRMGMECCKPSTPKKKCSAKEGLCMSKKFTCPNRITNDMNDCLPTEICCINHDQ